MSDAASTTVPMERRYRLVELQREALKIQTKIDDFSTWGAPALDQQGYQQKEKRQRETAHSKRGSIFWALVERTSAHEHGTFGEDDDVGDEDIPAANDTILCHCESHLHDCAFKRDDSDTIVRGFSHHIGSVFTLPAFRGQGLSTFFMTAVRRRLARLPNSIGSVLYSDIGPTFYDRLGWRCYPSTLAELNLSFAKNAQVVALDNDRESDSTMVDLHLDSSLDEFLERDNQRVLADMVTDKYQNREVFASLLTRNSIEWQFCIGVLYAEIRGYPQLPSRCGVKIDDDAFVLWYHNLKEATLYIVHARFPRTRPDAIAQLLRAALGEAHLFKLDVVVVWEPSDALFSDAIAEEMTIFKLDREDSLSSLIVFDHLRSREATNLPVWLNNEKHAWS